MTDVGSSIVKLILVILAIIWMMDRDREMEISALEKVVFTQGQVIDGMEHSCGTPAIEMIVPVGES